MDDKLIKDLQGWEAVLYDLGIFLDKIYYHPEFGTFSTRPIISMLVTGAHYLKDNLKVLREKYQKG